MGRPRDDGTDNAIASGSSVAIQVLQRLWVRSGDPAYRQRLERLIGRFATAVAQQPHNYAYLLTALMSHAQGELGARAYAARGGIRLEGRLHPQSGEQRRLTVSIRIPRGWHINSSDPGQDALIGTRLELPREAADWKLVRIDYPPGQAQHVAFQEAPLSLYTGEVRLEATITPAGGSPGCLTLPVSVRLQACNDETCLPPETAILRIPLH